MLTFLKSHIPLVKAKEGEPVQFARVAKAIIENPYATGTVWRVDGGVVAPNF